MKLHVLSLLFLTIPFMGGCGLLGNDEKEPAPTIPGKLVFSALDENDQYQIYTSLTNGTKLKQLTDFKDNEALSPSWSNDGTQIAFTTSLNATTDGASLYVMNADGSNKRPLKERPNTNIVTPGNNPAWSPDDSKIAFDACSNCERGGNNFDIYVYDFKTDSIKKITKHTLDDTYPSWGIDSKKLYFSSGREYYYEDTLRFRRDIYSFDFLNSLEKKVTNTGYATIPNYNFSTGHLFFVWNIGGNTVFCSDSTLKDFRNFKTQLKYAGNPKFSRNGEKVVIFGREGESSIPQINYFDFKKCENNELLDKEIQSRFISTNFGIDWFYD